MKKLIAYTLIITLILPVYCLSSPGEVVASERAKEAVINNGILLDEILLMLEDEEVIGEFMLMVEDGKMDIEEIGGMIGLLEEKLGVEPSFNLEYCLYNIFRSFICLITLDFSCFANCIDNILYYCS